MAFTSKRKVVARLDVIRNATKAAAIKTIEENMKTTKTSIFNVYFKGDVKGEKGDALHVEDLQAIVDGYAAQGWSVVVKTTQAQTREGGAEICFTFS